MKNQVFTPKMILSSIGIIVISVILSYVDSLMPNILQVEGYVTHQAWVGAAITAAGGDRYSGKACRLRSADF